MLGAMQTEDKIVRVMTLLESRAGLCPDVLGRGTVERALKHIADEDGTSSSAVTAQLLSGNNDFWKRLIEQVVIPETWFLRHPQAFSCLSEHVRAKYLDTERPIRVLSCPCATGEESYSIAIALIELGMARDRICIDAMDISQVSIDAAKAAVFTSRSLREAASEFILRYAVQQAEIFQIAPEIRSLVHFRAHNIVDGPMNEMAGHYEVIFCRNLLIYLNENARKRLVEKLHLSLTEGGLLFIGSAENDLVSSPHFTKLPHSQAFAYLKKPTTGKQPARRHNSKYVAPADTTVQAPPLNAVPKLEKPLPSFEAVRQLADRGLLENSAKMCQVLLDQNPLDSALHFLLGEISEAARNFEESEKHFERVVYLDPDHYEALMHLSLSRARRGDVKGSQRLRERARRAAEKAEYDPERS